MSSVYSCSTKFTHLLIFSSSLSYKQGVFLHTLEYGPQHNIFSLLSLKQTSSAPHPHSPEVNGWCVRPKRKVCSKSQQANLSVMPPPFLKSGMEITVQRAKASSKSLEVTSLSACTKFSKSMINMPLFIDDNNLDFNAIQQVLHYTSSKSELKLTHKQLPQC